MERKPEESFEEYKERRAKANQAVKDINNDSRGGSLNVRANRPNKGRVSSSYGESLRAYFAGEALEKIKAKA